MPIDRRLGWRCRAIAGQGAVLSDLGRRSDTPRTSRAPATRYQAGQQRAIGERALIALGRGDLETARALLDRQEEICRRTRDLVGLAACVGNRAILLRQTGDLAGALTCLDEQRELSKATRNGQGYLNATANRGEVLGAMGRVEDGLAALNEARVIAANAGLTPMVQELDRMIAALRGGPS